MTTARQTAKTQIEFELNDLQRPKPLPQNLPPITILMATYNGARHINAQLASIAAQDHSDWALLVSDDGSTDTTVGLINAFSKQHPNNDIRIINGPQKGAAANFLNLLCHPDLPIGPVALSDQDDIWYPEKLRLALTTLPNHTKPAVYSAQSRHITANGTPISASRIHNGAPSFGNALVQNRVAGHCATLNAAALELLRKAGPVDVPFHDWWIYMLIQGAGGTVTIKPDIVLDYRQHDTNVLGGNRRSFAGLTRVLSVLGSTFRGWQSQNTTALQDNRALLTETAKHTLDTWESAPPLGLTRMRLLSELGIVRDARHTTQLLQFAAFLGRI